MRCMHPVTVSVDGRREFVPCGKCNFCLESRRADWSFRLRQELKVSSSAHFLTLTYEKEPKTASGVSTLRKKDFQDFFKRLRKASVSKLRYYAVGEYGTRTARPHYHVILFNASTAFLDSLLVDLWSHGHVDVGTVTDASIHYVTKYHVNAIGVDFGDRAPPFALMSRRPGIGSNYLSTHSKWHLDGLRGFTQVNGMLARLPRFYVDKIFTKDQKQLIASNAPSEVVAYREEIARLSKVHPEPLEYYNERLRAAHDGVTHKSDKKVSKF